MRGVYFLEPGKLEMREVPIPQPGPGEVVIKVESATTCGTDLKAYRRGHKLFKPPMPFGHEYAGIVSAVGAGVSSCGRPEPSRVRSQPSAPHAIFWIAVSRVKGGNGGRVSMSVALGEWS